MSATLGEVNALLHEVRQQFPFGELYTDRRQNEVDGVIQGSASALQADLAELGAKMRDPTVMGDRWNLIAEIQQFRFRFRELIGAMVFDSASLISGGEVKRSEVEPGHAEALQLTLTVRSTTTDLRRLMRARLGKVADAEPEDVEWNAQQLEKELDSFGRTPAWRSIQAQDKKSVLEFRRNLRLINKPEIKKSELAVLLEPFVDFVDSFENVNDREILKVHDREVCAACGVQLEHALSIAGESPAQAMAAFKQALAAAVALYGRSADLDMFLRRTRKSPPAKSDELPPTIEIFTTMLADLSLY